MSKGKLLGTHLKSYAEEGTNGMYGKIFEQMYTGSMMGSGAMMFAVWPFIISHMKPNRDRTVFMVELNTELMAVLIGEKESEIKEVIEKCCEPDTKSRTPAKEGRKLVKHGPFLYEVVNGAVYDKIRRAEELRESNRRRQATFREKQKGIVSGEKCLEMPKGLQTAAFQKAWGEWQVHLKEKKVKKTPSAVRKEIEKCAELGEEAAIASINKSISSNWQGIFEPNNFGSKNTKASGHVSAC